MKGNLKGYHRTPLPYLRIHLILLLYFSLYVKLTTGNYYQMRKCCLSEKLLSDRSRIDCITEYDATVELYSYSDIKNLQSYVIPNCDNLNSTTKIYLDGIKSDDLNKTRACLDIIQRDNTLPKELPILVYCHLNKNNTLKIANELSSIVTTIRRCCPKDMIYDPNDKSCVSLNYSVSEFQLLLINNNNNNNNNDDNMINYYEDPFMSLLPIVKSKDFVLAVTRGPPYCRNAIFDFHITSNDLLYDDGFFKVKPTSLSQNEITKDQVELTNNNTCYEVTPESTISNGKLILRACYHKRICSDKLCIRKCCPEDRFILAGKGSCKKLTNDSYVKPVTLHEEILKIPGQRNIFENDYGKLIGIPCGKHGMFPLGPYDNYSITSNGHIEITEGRTYDHDEYCIDSYHRGGSTNGTFHSFICFEDAEKECNLRCDIYTVLQLISCGFLFITLVVYVCLPLLQNLHGKTLMCHVASLFCAYFCLAIINWVTPQKSVENSLSTKFCKILGYTMLFSFLSAFSWLNVMCFDIWWTFGGSRGSTSTRRRGHWKRFLLYCLYALGFACFITVLAIVADNFKFLPIYLRPSIGLVNCWFARGRYHHGEIMFFIGPITFQLIINILFFVFTSINCNKVKAEIDRIIVDPSDARNKRYQADRTRLMMNIKLFIVMGVTWIFEIISYFVNKYAKEWEWREEFFYLSDSFNCLQGLAIFTLFVLKKRVYQSLKRRLGFKDKRSSSNATTAVNDTYRINKSASNSTIMSTFQVSSTP